jgi:DNA-binding transcriptional MerR regulator
MNSSSHIVERQQEKALTVLRTKLRLPNGRHGCTQKELSDWTALSEPQIRTLADKGVLTPKRDPRGKKGRRLFYSAEDVLKALIVSRIRDAGFSLQQLSTAIHNLKSLSLTFNAKTHLLTEGKSIQVAIDDGNVVDILRSANQFMLLVSIEDQIEKVQRVA